MDGQRHLAMVIESLAWMIADGTLTLVPDMWADDGQVIDIQELQRLAALCDDRHLPIEAARIRRWLGQDVTPSPLRGRSCPRNKSQWSTRVKASSS